MISLDETGAEALQALVTPATFEGIATQLEEAQREKQRIIDQRVRISQGKSSARIAGQPELASVARVVPSELSRKAQKKYLNMVHNKYLERKSQNPKKSDGGNPGNQTKRLNSLHDKHVQLSLNNHCHSIFFSLCENTKQFSCSVKAYGPLAHTFLQSRCGQVLVGSFFDYCDNLQDERVSLGKQYSYNGYECAGNPERVPHPSTLTPPPEEQSMDVEESETEQNNGLSIQNRELPSDDYDSQLDASFQDEGQPSVSHSVSNIRNKTQEKVSSNPGTVRDIPQPLSSSPVKRRNPERVEFAGVEKRARTSTSSELQATQVVRPPEQSIITGCRSNSPKASEPRSVASIDGKAVQTVIKEFKKMTKDQAIVVGNKLFERFLSSKPRVDNSMELCLVQDMINGWEQPETFLAQLKMVTKNNYSNVPHLLESIKDMLPHVQQALVSKEMYIEGIYAPFLFDSLSMTEAHALSSGPMFLGRILDRLMQQKKTLQARKQDLLLVQHTVYGWIEPQHFICKINEILKLNIPETEDNFNNLKVGLEFIGHGLRSGKVQIAGIVAPLHEETED
ncbi:hypothetical protein GHT06_009522 [Daphnia sinensis]|uniref:Uncharacterized protein n=1 Tax=Daphnia sinensis TaxID=1820382 RepID=A0AAD5KTT5_9CRUS|nr:hypothetical protein GHT06_001526 [Daphnia sinensis]KAI9565730.1 hypothetical protein GHT06_009522 [Daphnia sinensis]